MSDLDNIDDINAAITRYRQRFQRHLDAANAAIREFALTSGFQLEGIVVSNTNVADVRIRLVTQGFILEIEYPIDCPGRILANGRMIVTPFEGAPAAVAFRRDVWRQLGEFTSENLTGFLRNICAWVLSHPVDDQVFERRLHADLIDIRPTYDGNGADIGGFLENGDPIEGRIRIWLDREGVAMAATEIFDQRRREPVHVDERPILSAPRDHNALFMRISAEVLTDFLKSEK